jgi:hypothetical protein
MVFKFLSKMQKLKIFLDAFSILHFTQFIKVLYHVFLILFVTSIHSKAQIGFNKSFDHGYAATIFGSVLISNDTIFTYGPLLKQGGPNGFSITLLDTFGQLLSVKEYFHPNGLNFTQVYPNSFIKLKHQSGFAVVGQVFDNGYGFLAITDAVGNVTDYHEYPDFSSRVDFYQQIIEMSDGYLIFGNKQDLSYWVNTFAMKTDFSGNHIWEKSFGTIDRSTYFGSAIIVNENEYVFGAGTSNQAQGVPLEIVSNTSKITAIDSLGELKWQWKSPVGLEEMGAGNLFKSYQGNWVYKTARGSYQAMYNEIITQPKIITRDAQFSLIQADTFGNTNFNEGGYFWNMTQLNDGGFLAMGIKSGVGFTQYGAPGWLVRLDREMGQVWSRADTTYLSFPTGFRCEYFDAAELPSGSIVVCGSLTTYDPVRKQWAWLVKVSADGCIETLNCFTSASEQPILVQLPQTTILPNPTTGIFNVLHRPSEGSAASTMRIFNLTGNQVFSQLVNSNTEKEAFDIAHLPAGLYFWSISDAVGLRSTGKLTKVD